MLGRDAYGQDGDGDDARPTSTPPSPWQAATPSPPPTDPGHGGLAIRVNSADIRGLPRVGLRRRLEVSEGGLLMDVARVSRTSHKPVPDAGAVPGGTDHRAGGARGSAPRRAGRRHAGGEEGGQGPDQGGPDRHRLVHGHRQEVPQDRQRVEDVPGQAGPLPHQGPGRERETGEGEGAGGQDREGAGQVPGPGATTAAPTRPTAATAAPPPAPKINPNTITAGWDPHVRDRHHREGLVLGLGRSADR